MFFIVTFKRSKLPYVSFCKKKRKKKNKITGKENERGSEREREYVIIYLSHVLCFSAILFSKFFVFEIFFSSYSTDSSRYFAKISREKKKRNKNILSRFISHFTILSFFNPNTNSLSILPLSFYFFFLFFFSCNVFLGWTSFFFFFARSPKCRSGYCSSMK